MSRGWNRHGNHTKHRGFDKHPNTFKTVCVCACMRVYVRIHLHMNKLYTCIFVYVRSRNVMGRSRQCCTGGLCHESETIPPLIQSSRIKQVRLKHCKCSILSKKNFSWKYIYIDTFTLYSNQGSPFHLRLVQKQCRGWRGGCRHDELCWKSTGQHGINDSTFGVTVHVLGWTPPSSNPDHIELLQVQHGSSQEIYFQLGEPAEGSRIRWRFGPKDLCLGILQHLKK
jgi:hypothetical protein